MNRKTHAIGRCLILLLAGIAVADVDIATLQLPATTGGKVVVSPYSTTFWKGTKIRIQAQPSPGYRFLAWTSGTTSLLSIDSLAMDSDKVLAAKFVDTAELVPYGDFAFGFKNWIKCNDALDTTKYSIRAGMGCINPKLVSAKSYSVQFLYDLPKMTKGQKFNLKLKANSNDTHRIVALLRNKNKPWNTLSTIVRSTANKTTQTLSFELVASDSATAPRLAFDLGLDSSEICFDDISLRRVAAPIVQLGDIAFRASGMLLSDGQLQIQTEAPGDWILRGSDGRILAQGSVPRTGQLKLADIPSGLAFLTLRTPRSSNTIRIVNF